MPADNFTVVFDLFNTLFRFLARPVVQRQLLAVLVALVAAGWVAWLIVGWGRGRYVGWYWHHRHELYNKRTGRKRWPARLRRALWIVAGQLVFPALAALALAGAAQLFATLGWLNGLLWAVLRLMGLFGVYRLLIAALYVSAEHHHAQRYHHRLFGPLMFVIIFLIVLSFLTDLGQLAQVIIFPLFDNPITIGALFLATVGLYFWIDAAYGLQDILKRVIVRFAHVHEGTVEASLTIMRYVLVALGIITAMSILGFNPTTVAAITGGLSIGVGLALQDVIKNFFGGLVILFEGSVRPGDYVEVGGKEAVVQKLNIRSTVVRTADNIEIIVPNQDWLTRSVTTYTGSSSRVRVRFPVTVPREVEIGRVFQLLNDTARKHPLTLDEPGPTVSIANFSGANVDYVLAAWIADATKMAKYSADLRLMLLRAFENEEVPLA